MKIAARLGMSPDEAKVSHSISQFQRWQLFFDYELNEKDKSEYATARVAYEVYQLRATLAAVFGVKLDTQGVEKFLTKFEFKEPEKVAPGEMTEEDRAQRAKEFSEASRMKWFAALGLNEKGQQVRKPPAPPQQPPQEGHLPARESTANAVHTNRAGQTFVTDANGKIRRIIKPGGGE